MDWKSLLDQIRDDRRAALATSPPTSRMLVDFRAGRLGKAERERVLEWAAADPGVARELLDVMRFPEIEPRDGDEALDREARERAWRRFLAALETDSAEEE